MKILSTSQMSGHVVAHIDRKAFVDYYQNQCHGIKGTLNIIAVVDGKFYRVEKLDRRKYKTTENPIPELPEPFAAVEVPKDEYNALRNFFWTTLKADGFYINEATSPADCIRSAINALQLALSASPEHFDKPDSMLAAQSLLDCAIDIAATAEDKSGDDTIVERVIFQRNDAIREELKALIPEAPDMEKIPE